MQLSLNRLGIKGLGSIVDRAYNGLEALNKVRNSFESNSHIYGLIITDLSMPVMDGYEATQNIREYYRTNFVPQPMIIACTGHVEEQFIKKAWVNEIDEVIPKPVNVELLADILNEVLVIADKPHNYDTKSQV